MSAQVGHGPALGVGIPYWPASAAGFGPSWVAYLFVLEWYVGLEGLVHHRGRIGGERVLARDRGQE